MDKLFRKQRKGISKDKVLYFDDIKRLKKYINGDIFQDDCILWGGTVKKGYNIFYYRKNKHLLNRLLYINYVNELEDGEYLHMICENNNCCCVNHIEKIS